MNARLRSVAEGFTLIEMIITLCVFLLLAGAIFSIFGATLESASTLQENQNREDSTQALAAWLRQSFLDLPADGTFMSYRRDDQPFKVSGIIWGAGNNLRAVDVRAQPNGNFLLRLAVYQPPEAPDTVGVVSTGAAMGRFHTQILSDDPDLNWRPLVRDLKAADWRFRMANSTIWIDSVAGGKPLFAEFTFQQAGTLGAVVDDFWLPPIVQAGNPALLQTAPAAVSLNP